MNHSNSKNRVDLLDLTRKWVDLNQYRVVLNSKWIDLTQIWEDLKQYRVNLNQNWVNLIK